MNSMKRMLSCQRSNYSKNSTKVILFGELAAMLTSEFDYLLTPDRIAQHPLKERTDAKLLHLSKDGADLTDLHVRDLPNLLQAGDLLVFNDSKVFKARLSAKRQKNIGIYEVFLLRPEGDIWYALIKRSKKLDLGDVLMFANNVNAQIVKKELDGVISLRFSVETSEVFALCDVYGDVPTPPYVAESSENEADYQTVYAKNVGSVAAPTAGFHFTQELLKTLSAKGVKFAYVTLHVGLGTFRPMQDGELDAHIMHSEWVSVSAETVEAINQTKAINGRVIAVGTTSVRSLETASQTGTLAPFEGMTNIFIRPGYTFKTIDGLMTNFHLPKSTLLVLVSALVGREQVLKAYQHAIESEYRFYSFGDAMLIL